MLNILFTAYKLTGKAIADAPKQRKHPRSHQEHHSSLRKDMLPLVILAVNNNTGDLVDGSDNANIRIFILFTRIYRR